MADHPCPECTPRSQAYCGFCGDGPYSPTGPFAARKFVEKKERVVTRESLLAEFDARADATRAQVKAELQAREPKPKRKPRRTKQQMAEHRAAVQERITKSYRELVGDGHFIDEPDEFLDPILKSEETRD